MKRIPETSLRFKIVGTITALLLAVTVMVGWLSSSPFVESNQTLMQELNFEEARKIADEIQETLVKAASHLRAEGRDLIERVELNADSHFVYLSLLDRDRTGGYRVEKSLRSVEQKDFDEVQHLTDWSSLLHLLESEQRPQVLPVHSLAGPGVIGIAAPYLESDHEFHGRILVGLLSAREIFDALGEADHGKIFVADALGRLLAQAQGSNLQLNADLKSRPSVKAFLERSLNSGRIRVVDETNQSSTFASFREIEFGRIGLITEIAESSAFSPLSRVQYRVFLIAIMVFCGAFVVGSLLSNSITRPIGQLADTALEIAGGKFDGQFDVDARNEVGALSRAFKRMLNELGVRQKALVEQEKLATAGRMARSIGHEFGNLLQPMIIKLDALQAELEASQVPQAAEKIEELIQIATLGSGICSGLMTLAREQRDASRFSDVSVAKMVKKVLGLMSHELKVMDVIPEVSIPDELKIVAVESQIIQVMVNLLVNSLHAMKPGGAIRIFASAESDTHHVRITVEDSGGGIKPEHLEKIFDPLFSTKGEKGNGLGLSIAKGILEAHGGKIRAESQPGVGTRMILEFPMNMQATRDAAA